MGGVVGFRPFKGFEGVAVGSCAIRSGGGFRARLSVRKVENPVPPSLPLNPKP